MSANLGFLFNRSMYTREQNGRVVECNTGSEAKKAVVDKITEAKPLDKEILQVCAPFRVPKAQAPEQPRQPAAQDSGSELEAMAALLNQKFGSRNAQTSRRDQGNKRGKNAPAAAQSAADAPQAPTAKDIMDKNGIVAFTMVIQYPGLYAGLGYEHGVGDLDEGGSRQTDPDFKQGFSFDYLTGLPYIPGSSLKGTLRAGFIDRPEDTLEALKEIMKSTEIDGKTLTRLETTLFGGRSGDDENARAGALTCYDVFPWRADNDTSAAIMADDFITPHPDPLKPANILYTLKIAPGVKLRFYLKLPEEIMLEGKVTVKRGHITTLFRSMLADWGVGAKTNTGYGTLR